MAIGPKSTESRRRRRLSVAVGLLAAFVALALAVAGHGALPIDRVAWWHRRSRPHLGPAYVAVVALTMPGHPVAIAILSAALAVILVRRWGAGRPALLVVLVPLLVAGAAEVLLKPLVARQGGAGNGRFPSVHTTGITSVATTAWLTWISRWDQQRARVAAATALVVVVALVGVGVVVMHWHYATDVVGGVLYGAGATLAVAEVTLSRSTR